MLGPSGSGKTTTLRLIAGFERPDSGSVELGGEDVSSTPALPARRQHRLPGLRALPAHERPAERRVRAAGQGRAQSRARRARRGGAARSCGWRATARASPCSSPAASASASRSRARIVNSPRVLLLDEPLGALDLKLREQMQVELKAIQQDIGITFLYVTHDQEEALTMSDRIAVFNEGRIEQVGTPEEIYERPAHRVRRRLRRRLEHARARRPALHRSVPRRSRWPPATAAAERPGRSRTSSMSARSRATSSISTRGDELTVMRQNLETTSEQVLEEKGRRVRLEWRPEHTFTIEAGRESHE